MGASRLAIHFLLDITKDVEDRYLINIICYTFSHIHSISVFGSTMCMNILAVEQQLATCCVNSYEKKNWVGVALIIFVVVQCVPSGIAINWFYLRNNGDLRTSRETCLPMDVNLELPFLGFGACLITCTGAAIVSISNRLQT